MFAVRISKPETPRMDQPSPTEMEDERFRGGFRASGRTDGVRGIIRRSGEQRCAASGREPKRVRSNVRTKIRAARRYNSLPLPM